MRVLLINQTFYPDHAATAQHAHDLARDLVAAGHEVMVIASRSAYGSRGAALPRRETVDGVEVHRVGVSFFGKASLLLRLIDFLVFYVLALFKAFTLRRPDVVTPFTTPPMIVLVGYLLSRVKRCACVYWVMDLYPDVPVAFGVLKRGGVAARGLEWVHRYVMRRVDRAVVLGRCMRDRVEGKGVPASRLALIRPWADAAELAPLDRDANPLRAQWGLGDRWVVMYSGNLGLAHDADTLFEAMRRLDERGDLAFVFVGGGKGMSQLEGRVREAGLSGVRFEPYQPRERLAASLSAADLHLISQSSSMTGLLVPSKAMGVMASGRPAVFVGDAEAEAGRLLAEEGAGRVSPPGDALGLAEAIAWFASHRDEARVMGAAARRAVVERYDRSHATAAWERLLQGCVDARTHPNAVH